MRLTIQSQMTMGTLEGNQVSVLASRAPTTEEGARKKIWLTG